MGALSTSDPRIGSELAGYRLEALLGRGGMGVVYRAHDLALDRNVALKILSPELAEDVRFRERFLTESRLAASIDHPNIIPVYDAGEVAGELYIAMRYVDGSDLKKLLVEGPLPAERAIAIVSQVAGALDAAHERGLVHRDVKPSNVLLDERRHAYLADFGLSRRLGEPGTALGAAQSLGTIDYVAPEQIRGEPVDGRADLYSLGCLLHECLTGKPPFARSTDSAVLYAHLEEGPPATPGLENVLPKALAKSPDDRYPTCAEFVADARSALGLEPRRLRWPHAVTIVGVALVGAALAGFFLTRGDSVTATATPAGDGRVVRIDPATGHSVSTVSFGKDLSSVAVGSGAVWIASLGSGAAARADPESGAINDTIPVAGAGFGPSAIAVAGDLVWIVIGGDDRVRLYDAQRREFSSPESSPPNAGIACACPGEDIPAVAEGRSLWTISHLQYALEHFTPELATAESSSLGAGNTPTALAVAAGVVWVVTAGTPGTPKLFKVDATTRRVIGRTTLPSSVIPSAVAVGDGAVWVADLSGDAVLRIERPLGRHARATNAGALEVTKRIRVGRAPKDIVVGLDSVWVANYLDGTISRIDPRTNRVDTFNVGPFPEHLAVGEGSVWVALDPP